jgi:hypothetical protein
MLRSGNSVFSAAIIAKGHSTPIIISTEISAIPNAILKLSDINSPLVNHWYAL